MEWILLNVYGSAGFLTINVLENTTPPLGDGGDTNQGGHGGNWPIDTVLGGVFYTDYGMVA